MNEPNWKQVDAWLRKKLDQERTKNDSPDLDDRQTGYTRGRIAMLKELLALPESIDKATRARMVEPE